MLRKLFSGTTVHDTAKGIRAVNTSLLTCAVLAAAIGIQSCALVYQLVTQAERLERPVPSVTPAEVHQESFDIAQLVGSNLFGKARNGSDDPKTAPATTDTLVLTGVLARRDPRKGIAILGPTAQETAVHVVGDTLPGGLRLHSVYADRILLDRDGTIESLRLPVKSSGPGPVEPTVSAGNSLALIDPDSSAVIGGIINPQPVRLGDRQTGYRVYPGIDGEAFASLGLRAGDVVTAIDGAQLGDPTLSKAAFRTLSVAPEAVVTVMRGGRQREIVLSLAQVTAEAERKRRETPREPVADPIMSKYRSRNVLASGLE